MSCAHKKAVVFILSFMLIVCVCAFNIPEVQAEGDPSVQSETPVPSALPQPTETPVEEPSPPQTPQPTEIPIEEPPPVETPEPSPTPPANGSELESTSRLNGHPCVAGEVLVKFKAGIDPSKITNTLESVDSIMLNTVSSLDLVVSQVPEGETIESFIVELEQQPGIEYAQPNYIYKLNRWITDPEASPTGWQSHLQQIGVYEAWDLTLGSSSVRVAVLDTGIDLNHPEFAGRIYKAYDAAESSTNAQDDVGHGTHVAGIIAANADGKKGAGIAPGVRLIAVDVFKLYSDPEGDYMGASTEDIIEGINYAKTNGARVLNMSLGSYDSDIAEKSAVDAAVAGGVVVVSSAGNDSTDANHYPSDFDSSISVISVNFRDVRSYFSNYGSQKDISAPGEGIYSTCTPGYNVIEGYTFMSGTSMASPMVAGVAALMLSANPSLTVDQVKSILYSTAVDTYAVGFDNESGYGRVDACAAVWAARAATGYCPFPGGKGTTDDPYIVSAPSHLYAMRYYPAASYKLSGNINMAASTSSGGAYNNGGLGWYPIENFRGTLDGNGYSITGLNVNMPEWDNVGLFSNILKYGNVTNLTMTGCTIRGYENVGAIAGENYGHIINCSVSNSLSATYGYLGGIAGLNEGTISHCINSANISAPYSSVGGIIGQNNALVTNCTNTGNVNGSVSITGGIAGQSDHVSYINSCVNMGKITSGNYCGGIVGASYDASVTLCYNVGNVSSTGCFVGGIAGYCSYTVSRCYNSGNISTTYNGGDDYYDDDDDIGGIVGCLLDGKIENCYNTGTITADRMIGGIAGSDQYSTIKNCYNMAECNISSHNGTVTGCYYLNRGKVYSKGTAKTAAQLRQQAIYSGYDFSTVWEIKEGISMPTLRELPTVGVSGVTISRNTMGMFTGSSGSLTASVTPSNATNKSVAWSSSNPGVAAVTNGVVTMVSAGTATITAETLDGVYTAQCIVDSNPVPVAAANSGGYDRIVVSWDQIPGASGYEVYRSASEYGEYNRIYTASSGSTLSYTNTGLVANQLYFYKVLAYKTGSSTVYGDQSAPVSAVPVPATTAVNPVSTSFTAIKVSWTAVPGASGYEVWYSTQKFGTYSLKYTSNSGATGSWTKSGLTTDKAYYFKMRAFMTVNGIRVYGPDSAIQSTAPGRPSFVVVRASSTSSKLTWIPISGSAGYEVWRGTTKNGTYSLKYTAKSTTTSWTNTGLSTGKAYYYMVRTWRMVSGQKVYGQFSAINSVVP